MYWAYPFDPSDEMRIECHAKLRRDEGTIAFRVFVVTLLLRVITRLDEHASAMSVTH